jgi:hypothetical protein
MESILKLALMFLADRRGGEPSGATRVTAGAACTGFAIVTLMAGIGCATAALWIYLIPRVGEAGAALSVAAVFLVSSGILLLVARNMFTPDAEDAAPGVAGLADMGEELFEELRAGFGNNKSAVVMAALVAGLLAGRASKKQN